MTLTTRPTCSGVGHKNNSAVLHRSYWGGSAIADVCLRPYQFECWDTGFDVNLNTAIQVEEAVFKALDRLTDVYLYPDPADGANHYHKIEPQLYSVKLKLILAMT